MNGIVSGVAAIVRMLMSSCLRGNPSARLLVMCSARDVLVERESQILPVLQHDRLVLSLALPGADAGHLVGLPGSGRSQSSSSGSSRPLARLPWYSMLQLAKPIVDLHRRWSGASRLHRAARLDEQSIGGRLFVGDEHEEARREAGAAPQRSDRSRSPAPRTAFRR